MSHVIANTPPHRHEPKSVQGAKTASGINMLLGVWLVVLPFLFAYTNVAAATWNSIVIGLIVIAAGWVRMINLEDMFNIGWVNLIAGLWLLASPWAFGFYHFTAPLWNTLTVGVIIIVVALSGLFVRPRPTTRYQ